MNYANGFPCPAEIQTDFVDRNSQSTWSAPPSMPTTWGHPGLVSNPVSAARPALWPWGTSSFFLLFFKSWSHVAIELSSDQLKQGLLPVGQGWGAFFLPRAVWILYSIARGPVYEIRALEARVRGEPQPNPRPLTVWALAVQDPSLMTIYSGGSCHHHCAHQPGTQLLAEWHFCYGSTLTPGGHLLH